MRVLLTRPHASASRLPALLRAAGHEAIVSPVIEIVSTGVNVQRGQAQAIVATSANAMSCLTDDAAQMLCDLPVYVVGQVTAAQAQARGFAKPLVVAASAHGLADAIGSRERSPLSFLYLAGKDRKSELERALRAGGHSVDTAVVYEARAVRALDADVETALRTGGVDAVLHFSRRSADIFCQLAVASGLGAAIASVMHVCISQDTAAALAGISKERIRIAEAPDTAHMLLQIER